MRFVGSDRRSCCQASDAAGCGAEERCGGVAIKALFMESPATLEAILEAVRSMLGDTSYQKEHIDRWLR